MLPITADGHGPDGVSDRARTCSGGLGILENHAISVAADGAELPNYIQERFELHELIVEALDARDLKLASELIIRHSLNG